MSEQTKSLIKILAIALIGYGGYKFISDFKGLWWLIQVFFYPAHTSFWAIAYYYSMTLLLSLLMPIGAICAGFGLLFKKKWGWKLSFIVSLFVFTVHCAGTVNFIIKSYQYKDVPMPVIPEGAHVEYISMIPTYIITGISFICIILLSRKSVKNVFIESKGDA